MVIGKTGGEKPAGWRASYIHTHTQCVSFLLCLALIFPLKIFAELGTLFHISPLFFYLLSIQTAFLFPSLYFFHVGRTKNRIEEVLLHHSYYSFFFQQLRLQQKSITRMWIQPFDTVQQKGKSKLVLQVQIRQSV